MQDRQIQNWLTGFVESASEMIAALDALEDSLRYYDAIGAGREFAPKALIGSEFEGLNPDVVINTVESMRLLLKTMRESSMYLAALAILPTPPGHSRMR